MENENNFFKFINIRKQLNVIINIIFGNNNTRELINENQFQNFKSIANKINNLSNLNNSKLYVVYIPIHWEYSKSLKAIKNIEVR